jgi:membrane fusion protein, heavy metal efflux system
MVAMKLSVNSAPISTFELTRGCKRLFVLIVVALSASVFGGEGHDHGETKTPAGAAVASPRFQGHSDLFEVVGILKGNELSITIDRYATNEPVLDAKVEVETGALKKVATFHADHGDYSLPSESFRKPGTYPITLTIVSGKDTDLIAGDLVVPDPEAGHDHSAEQVSGLMKWAKPAGIAALALIVLMIAVSVLRSRRVRV